MPANYAEFLKCPQTLWAVLQFGEREKSEEFPDVIVANRQYGKLRYEDSEPETSDGEVVRRINSEEATWVLVQVNSEGELSLSTRPPTIEEPKPIPRREPPPVCFGPCAPFQRACPSGSPTCPQPDSELICQ